LFFLPFSAALVAASLVMRHLDSSLARAGRLPDSSAREPQ
jgi:hypothetical protein